MMRRDWLAGRARDRSVSRTPVSFGAVAVVRRGVGVSAANHGDPVNG